MPNEPQSVVQDSCLPLLVRAGTRLVIIINNEDYKGTETVPTSAQHRQAYEQIVRDVMLEGIKVSPTLSEAQKQQITEAVKNRDASTSVLNNVLKYPSNMGTPAGFDKNTFFLILESEAEPGFYKFVNNVDDPPREFATVTPVRLPSNVDQVNRVFTKHHELGHLIYDLENNAVLEDPAADYIAAVRTRLEVANADAGLQVFEDYRTAMSLTPMMTIRAQNGQPMSHFNGTETMSGRSIRAALELSAERLQELKAMPEDELRQTLRNEAKVFDDRLNFFKAKEPEKAIIEELKKREETIERLSDQPNERAYQIARNLLDENCPYKSDSEEYKILKDYADARLRIIQGYASGAQIGPENHVPSTAPDNSTKPANKSIVGLGNVA